MDMPKLLRRARAMALPARLWKRQGRVWTVHKRGLASWGHKRSTRSSWVLVEPAPRPAGVSQPLAQGHGVGDGVT